MDLSSYNQDDEERESQVTEEDSLKDDTNSPCSTISKNQAKKLRKHQEWLAKLPERRRLERLKKKEKKAASKQNDNRLGPIVPRRFNMMKDSTNKFIIVIDLDFNDFMSYAERSKLVKQIGRIYATNRKAAQPCQLYLTSLHGKIKEQMDKSQPGYVNWDIHKYSDTYLDLFANKNGEVKGNNTGPTLSDTCDQIVYMTGDSEDTLPDIDKVLDGGPRIFVIGGLVDKNRHKGLCYKRAVEYGVKTAKLPIDSNVKLNQRYILSTFAVFEILLLITGTSGITWEEALKQAIPKRKQASYECVTVKD